MALRVTAKWLEKMEACEGQVELFREVYPRGIAVTLKNLRRAEEAGFQLCWLVDEMDGIARYASHIMWDAYNNGIIAMDSPEMIMVAFKAMVKRGRKRL